MEIYKPVTFFIRTPQIVTFAHWLLLYILAGDVSTRQCEPVPICRASVEFFVLQSGTALLLVQVEHREHTLPAG